MAEAGAAPLARVELWRALGDRDGGSAWAEHSRVSVSGSQASGTLTDRLSQPGVYLYGLHAVDTVGAWVSEAPLAPLVVSVPGPWVRSFVGAPAMLTSGQAVSLSWDVAVVGPTGLERVELWRGREGDAGVADAWQQLTSRGVTGTAATGTFADTPGTGVWWYGVHVVALDGAWSSERQETAPVRITVRP